LGWTRAIGILLAGGAVVLFIGGFFWRTGSARIHAAARLSAVDAAPPSGPDPRPPVLYLRSFQDDGIAPKYPDMSNLLGNAMYRTDEQKLIEGLKVLGPVVAIGKPGETVPEAGAARSYFSESEWREEVTNRMHASQIVVVRCATTEGLLWELQTALKQVLPERLLIWLMFSGNREEQWNQFCSRIESWLPLKLPAKLGNALFLSFESDWNPRLFGSIGAIHGALDPKIFLPFLQRLHPNAHVTLKQEPFSLKLIRALAVAQVIAIWVALIVTVATYSSRAVVFWAILCGTGGVLGAIGLREGVKAAAVLGFVIPPTILLAIMNHMPRDNDPTDVTGWVLFTGAFAALLLLIWLALSLERRRDRRFLITK